MMLVVTDRRKAVAMLMAMGGGRADITAVFFLQGGLIGVVGALVWAWPWVICLQSTHRI